MADLLETDTGLDAKGEAEETAPEKDLDAVYRRAMRRFDDCATPTMELRRESLTARRFITIPGAQWEDEWGEQFENSIKLEIDKVGRGVEKIERDYRDNRIVPDFRPDGKNADQDTADTLDGLHRADSYRFKSQQARDNAVFEAIAGGFGAYRLTTEWDDEQDKDNDHLRINPAAIIADADQSVFFDLNAKLYDKSDARFAFIRTAMTRDAYADEWPDAGSDFPEGTLWKVQDWFRPDVCAIAEYFEREDAKDALWVCVHPISGEQKRLWASEIEPGTITSLKADGWTAKRQSRKRCRVHKYILSGAEVLEDCGLIVGEHIPIVPIYGKRYFVDGMERWQGYVQKKMDSARLYNSMVSQLAEVSSRAPFEVPVFAPDQIDSVQADQWARANIDRLPYLTAHPLLNPDGSIAQLGPIGKVEPPQVGQAMPLLLQIANTDLLEEMQDSSDQVKSNTSAEAMDIAATRVDAKSGIYLDNIRQSVQREGEIYLPMATEVYSEAGREAETMSEDGDDGIAVIKQDVTDPKTEEHKTINDLSAGRYKVIVSVSEATATRKDKTVKAMMNVAAVANEAGNAELANAAIITAVSNIDGEGLTDFQKFVRKTMALPLGLVEPNEEEAKAKAAAEAEQQPAAPDPTANALNAQAKDFEASAGKKLAETDKTKAQTAEIIRGLLNPDTLA